jgi:hypothetical protein
LKETIKEKQRKAKRDALKKLKNEIKNYESACSVLGIAGMVISPIEVTLILFTLISLSCSFMVQAMNNINFHLYRIH